MSINKGEQLQFLEEHGFSDYVFFEVWQKDFDESDFSRSVWFYDKQLALNYVSALRSNGIDSFVCVVERIIIDILEEDIK